MQTIAELGALDLPSSRTMAGGAGATPVESGDRKDGASQATGKDSSQNYPSPITGIMEVPPPVVRAVEGDESPILPRSPSKLAITAARSGNLAEFIRSQYSQGVS